MKIGKIISLLVITVISVAYSRAQTAPIQGFCAVGGIKAATQGLQSTNTLMGSYPKCLVTVYIAGTIIPATIYADSNSTPLTNPFTANTNASWLFYSSVGVGVDIKMSGGTPIPLPSPFTFVNVFPGSGGGGSGGVTKIIAGNNITISPSTGVGQVTINSTGGGSNPPSCPADGTHALTAPDGSFVCVSIQTGTLPPYMQNQVVAAATNPYNTIAITATPQDCVGCQNAGLGIPDDAVPFDTEMIFLASLEDTNAYKTLTVPWTRFGYNFQTTNYLIDLSRDFGDYHGAAGFASAATVQAYFTNGSLTSCAVTGGSKYAPNAQLPVQIIDPAHIGSGADANVATDSSGTPTSCTPTAPGMRYPQVGVTTSVIPLGGDGAAGTVNLVNGSIQVGAGTLTAGGSGYASGVVVNVSGIAIAANGTEPVFSSTVTNASVTGFSVTSGGSGITFGGSPNASNIPAIFGASCGGVQCHLIAPEPPVQQACSVAVRKGVKIIGTGSGTTINSPYTTNGKIISLTTPVPFCDPWGDQLMPAQGEPAIPFEVDNLTINGMIDFFFVGQVSGVKFSNVTFQGGAPFYAGALVKDTNSILTPNTVVENSEIFTSSDIILSGGWASRNPTSGAGGVFGGTDYTHPDSIGFSNRFWGQFTGLTLDNVRYEYSPNANTPTGLDSYLQTYIFQAQNGPTTPFIAGFNNLSNGSTTCPGTTVTTDRTTDYDFGHNFTGSSGTIFNYPYYSCFMGTNGTGVWAHGRFSRPYSVSQSAIDISNSSFQTYRPILSGGFTNYNLQNITERPFNGMVPTDPYLPAGVTNSAVQTYAYGMAPAGNIDTLNATGYGTNILSTLYIDRQQPEFINVKNTANVNGVIPTQIPINTWVGTPFGPSSFFLNIFGGIGTNGFVGLYDGTSHFWAWCVSLANCGGTQPGDAQFGGFDLGYGVKSGSFTGGHRAFSAQNAAGHDVFASFDNGAATTVGNHTMYGLIINSTTVSGGPGVGTSTTGGTLVANTTYSYRIVSNTSFGSSLPSGTSSITTGSSTSTNSVTVQFASQPGIASYDIYGRTGSPGTLQKLNTSPIMATGNVVTFVDTGAATPSGALPTVDNSFGVKVNGTNGFTGTCTLAGITTITVVAGIITGCS